MECFTLTSAGCHSTNVCHPLCLTKADAEETRVTPHRSTCFREDWYRYKTRKHWYQLVLELALRAQARRPSVVRTALSVTRCHYDGGDRFTTSTSDDGLPTIAQRPTLRHRSPVFNESWSAELLSVVLSWYWRCCRDETWRADVVRMRNIPAVCSRDSHGIDRTCSCRTPLE